MRLSLPLFLLLFLPSVVLAQQDFGWWNEANDWDGTSPWRSYLTLAPAFLGPNALPVPEVQNGLIEQRTILRLAADGHFSEGDDTQNLFVEFSVPLFSDRVALNLQYVPFEVYHMTTRTRDERSARDFDGRGTAAGDIYVSTHVQLLRDHAKLPDVLLTINLKTASGNQLDAARYTDTPGYFFDVSVGKTYALGEGLRSVRPHVMAGFYVWQTYQDLFYQNDAILFGLGADLNFRDFTVTNALGGYSGYLGEGDRPLVYRLTMESRLERRFNYLLRFQRGITDFPYTSVRLGGTLRLGK